LTRDQRRFEMKRIEKVPLREIDLSDETCSINFMPDIQRLRSSLLNVGLIQPLLLRRCRTGCQIVCGFRRLSLLREIGESAVDSIVFSEEEMEPREAFDFCLHENTTTRGFNTVEIGMALDRLVHLFGTDPAVVIKTYLPLLSLETNEKILNTYLSLARMEDEIKEYVVREQVSRTNIRILAKFAPGDRVATAAVLRRVKLGENRLRELLTLLEEISRRDRRTVKEIIDGSQIGAVLGQEELTPLQRAERLKKVLIDIRYPKLKALEDSFEERRKGLHLGSTVRLEHPPHFEGKGLKLGFQFERSDQFREILSSLIEIADREDLAAMLSLRREP
jgi:ParB family transcriptional regulator, chromosome partitioning protein